jgi:hypothetical protein
VLHYIYARLLSAHHHKWAFPFRQDFLERLSLKLSGINLLGDQEPEFSTILSRFLSLINDDIAVEEMIKLSDIVTLPVYFDSRFEEQPPGLRFGYAGAGIKKIQTRQKKLLSIKT